MSGLSLSINNKNPQQTIFLYRVFSYRSLSWQKEGHAQSGRSFSGMRCEIDSGWLYEKNTVRKCWQQCSTKKTTLKKSCRCPYFFTFWKGYEGDPLSPPAGEAAQGEHPLDPPLSISKENFPSTFSEEISHFFQVTSPVRTKATVAAAWKERQNNFTMISIEPKNPITGTPRSAWFCGQRFSIPLFSSKARLAAWGERP